MRRVRHVHRRPEGEEEVNGAMTVRCPKCKAEPGDLCRLVKPSIGGGGAVKRPHTERRKLARRRRTRCLSPKRWPCRDYVDPKPAAVHFRVLGEERYAKPRLMCGERGKQRWSPWNETRELHPSVTVLCSACMVVKDVWLEAGQPALTIRKARAFLKSKGIEARP